MSASVPSVDRRSYKGSVIIDRTRELQSKIEAAKTLLQHETERHSIEIQNLRDELEKVRRENLKYQSAESEKQYLQSVNVMPWQEGNSQKIKVAEKKFNIILLVINIGIVVTYFLKWIDVSLQELSLLKCFMYVGKLIDYIYAKGNTFSWQLMAILFLFLVMGGSLIYHLAAIGQQILSNKTSCYIHANVLNLVCTLTLIITVKYAADKVNGMLFNLTSMGITAVPVVNTVLSVISLVMIYYDKKTGADVV